MKHSTYTTLLLTALLSTQQAHAAPTAKTTPQRRSTAPSYPASSNLTYITLEEHYDSPASLPAQEQDPVFAVLEQSMSGYAKYTTDIEQYRLPSMNNNSIRMSILANDPTPAALSNVSLTQTMNNQLSSAIAAYPSRFRGFCFLPMADPAAASSELTRCVQDLGFVGALMDGRLPNMTFYDTQAYDVFWETAQRLGVPVYLHPTYAPGKDVLKPHGRETPVDGDISETVAAVLSAHGFGWHADNGLNFLRLWVGGVFDRFSGVKVVLGHMGETMPYMLDRAEGALGAVKTSGVSVKEAWAKNVWVTTSGFFSLNPFATLVKTTAVERILFSVDYPWATNEMGAAFMAELKTSGMVTEDEWEMIAFKNAQALLKL